MNIQTQDVLNLFYKNIDQKDGEAIVSMLTDDIDWYIVRSEKLPWTGRWDKKAEIAKILELLFNAHVDGKDQLEMDHNFIDGNEAAVFGKISRQVSATGKIFMATFCQRFTIKEGKIARFLMLEDTPEILKAF